MIEKVLSSLDIGDEEIRAYMALLEHQSPVTVGALAKQLGMARASLYGFLGRLQDKGLVKQTMKSNVKAFSPEPPEKIDLIFKKKIEEVEASRKDFKNVLKEIEKKAAMSSLTPRFTMFEGVEGVKHILNDMLMYRNIETFSWWPISEMMDILNPEFFRYHNTNRIRNNISVRALWPKGRVVNVSKFPFMGEGPGFLREIRIVPEEIDYTMGYWAYKNKIAYLSSRRESFGFIIESDEMVQTTKMQFDFLWEHSTKAKARGPETEASLEEIRNF